MAVWRSPRLFPQPHLLLMPEGVLWGCLVSSAFSTGRLFLLCRGLPSQAFEYILYNGGLMGEDTYPYRARVGLLPGRVRGRWALCAPGSNHLVSSFLAEWHLQVPGQGGRCLCKRRGQHYPGECHVLLRFPRALSCPRIPSCSPDSLAWVPRQPWAFAVSGPRGVLLPCPLCPSQGSSQLFCLPACHVRISMEQRQSCGASLPEEESSGGT